MARYGLLSTGALKELKRFGQTDAAIVTDETPPAAPTNLVTTPGNQQITLEWTNPPEQNLDSIRVYRGTTSGSLQHIVTVQGDLVPGGTASFTDTGTSDEPLVNGTTYYYAVSAVNTSGVEGSQSSEVSEVPEEPIPDMPSGATHDWEFDQVSASTLPDQIGTVDLPEAGAPTAVTFGRDFDGVDDAYGQIDSGLADETFDYHNVDFTFAALFKAPLSQPNSVVHIFQTDTNTTDTYFSLQIRNSLLTAAIEEPGTGATVEVSADWDLYDAEAILVTVRWDASAGTLSMWVNDSAITEVTPDSFKSGGHGMAFAARNDVTDYFFDGTISRVMTWDRLLSDTEVDDLFQNMGKYADDRGESLAGWTGGGGGGGTEPGSTYFTDFSEYVTGSPPSDWTERWNTSNSDWDIVDDDEVGANSLVHTASSEGRRLLSWDDIDADAERADVEILSLLRTDTHSDVGSGERVQNRIYARASGTVAGSDFACYFVALHGNDKIVVEKYSGTNTPRLGEAAFTWSANQQLMIRFRVEGSTIRAKIWVPSSLSDPTANEPTGWTLSLSDIEHSAAGWVGVGTWGFAGNRYWQKLAVATGGKTAAFASESGGEGEITTLSEYDVLAGTTGATSYPDPGDAFPSAEGYGRNATGGRDAATTLYFVTNLNESGAGSLRAALEATGPRIIVPLVWGVIDLGGNPGINAIDGNFSYFGQFIPAGQGLYVKGGDVDPTLNCDGNNIILRYFKAYRGVPVATLNTTGDAITMNGSNYIMDRCAAAFGIDENLNTFHPDTVTVQHTWSIESIHDATHSDGDHGKGMSAGWGTPQATTVLGCFFALNQDRNPVIRSELNNANPNEAVNNYLFNCDVPLTFTEDQNTDNDGWVNVVKNHTENGAASTKPYWGRFGKHQAGAGELFAYAESNIGPGRETDTGGEFDGISNTGGLNQLANRVTGAPAVREVAVENVKDWVLDFGGPSYVLRQGAGGTTFTLTNVRDDLLANNVDYARGAQAEPTAFHTSVHGDAGVDSYSFPSVSSGGISESGFWSNYYNPVANAMGWPTGEAGALQIDGATGLHYLELYLLKWVPDFPSL